MNIADINALTIWDVFIDMLYRHYDFGIDNPAPQENWIDFDTRIHGNIYDQLVISHGLVKPDFSELEAIFEIYKQDLLDYENARLAENARVAAIDARIDALADLRSVADLSGETEPNLKVLRNRIVFGGEESLLDTFESNNSTIITKMEIAKAEKQIDERFDVGMSAIKKVVLLNGTKGLNKEQKKQLTNDLNSIKMLLDVGDLDVARDEIASMTLPANISESDRSAVLDYLDSEIARIGEKYA